jgi:hypothetical protein
MNKVIVSLLVVSAFGFQNVFAMAGANPNQQLLQGAFNLDFAQIRDALKLRADVNAVDVDNNNTALNLVTSINNYTLVQYLLDHGANPNMANGAGMTPLHYAVLWLNPRMVKLLLDNGADPTLRNIGDKTPADYLRDITPDQENYQQKSARARQIRQYFEEAARPTPELAGRTSEVATLE